MLKVRKTALYFFDVLFYTRPSANSRLAFERQRTVISECHIPCGPPERIPQLYPFLRDAIPRLITPMELSHHIGELNRYSK